MEEKQFQFRSDEGLQMKDRDPVGVMGAILWRNWYMLTRADPENCSKVEPELWST